MKEPFAFTVTVPWVGLPTLASVQAIGRGITSWRLTLESTWPARPDPELVVFIPLLTLVACLLAIELLDAVRQGQPLGRVGHRLEADELGPEEDALGDLLAPVLQRPVGHHVELHEAVLARVDLGVAGERKAGGVLVPHLGLQLVGVAHLEVERPLADLHDDLDPDLLPVLRDELGDVGPRGELRHGDAAANFNSYGTTLRVYDPDIDAWRIQWTDPVTRNFLQMIGRAEGRDIVQLGTRPDGQLARWSFADITADSFLWRGEGSADAGATWRVVTEFTARRREA